MHSSKGNVNSNNEVSPHHESWDDFGFNLKDFIFETKSEYFKKNAIDLIIGFTRGGMILASCFSTLLRDHFKDDIYNVNNSMRGSLRPIPSGISVKRYDKDCFIMDQDALKEETDDIPHLLKEISKFRQKLIETSGLPSNYVLQILLVDDNLTASTRIWLFKRILTGRNILFNINRISDSEKQLLNQGTIPDKIIEAFKLSGKRLSEHPIINLFEEETDKKSWNIFDNGNHYIIEKEKINVLNQDLPFFEKPDALDAIIKKHGQVNVDKFVIYQHSDDITSKMNVKTLAYVRNPEIFSPKMDFVIRNYEYKCDGTPYDYFVMPYHKSPDHQEIKIFNVCDYVFKTKFTHDREIMKSLAEILQSMHPNDYSIGEYGFVKIEINNQYLINIERGASRFNIRIDIETKTFELRIEFEKNYPPKRCKSGDEHSFLNKALCEFNGVASNTGTCKYCNFVNCNKDILKHLFNDSYSLNNLEIIAVNKEFEDNDLRVAIENWFYKVMLHDE